jgi:hypothetical protein
MIQGFTQLGAIGIGFPLALTLPESEGLTASAMEVAPTATVLRPQALAKNVGKSVRWTLTVTCGVITKLGPLENETVTSPDTKFLPPTSFCIATDVAI